MQHRHVCPGGGSAAVERTNIGWRCTNCGHQGKRFPEAHAQHDDGRLDPGGVRQWNSFARGYQRRALPLDE